MSFLSGPQAPLPPPPPPLPPTMANSAVQDAGAAARAAAAAASGGLAFDGTVKTGSEGAPTPSTSGKSTFGDK